MSKKRKLLVWKAILIMVQKGCQYLGCIGEMVDQKF